MFPLLRLTSNSHLSSLRNVVSSSLKLTPTITYKYPSITITTLSRAFSTAPEALPDDVPEPPPPEPITPVSDAAEKKKKRSASKKAAEMKKEKETPEQQEFNEFKNRVQLARLKGEEGERDMEAELDKNGANGRADFNKQIVDKAINEIYDVLYPYGFHSIWLYKVARKWAGDEVICAYLLKNKNKNWYMFAPRRQINQWQDCVEDFIAGPVVGDKVTVTNVLDLLKTYYMDIEERKKYTFLEEMIEPVPIKDFKKLVKTCADNIPDEDNLAFFYTKFLRDYPVALTMLQSSELHELLKECIEKLKDPLNVRNLQQEIVNNEKCREMKDVMELVPAGMEPKIPEKKEEAPTEASGENANTSTTVSATDSSTATTSSANTSSATSNTSTDSTTPSEPKKEENNPEPKKEENKPPS